MVIRFTYRGKRQVQQASQWWRENRSGATDLFEKELRRAFDLLAGLPQIGQPVANVELPDVRRLFLRRIEYHLYYQPQHNGILFPRLLAHEARTTAAAVALLTRWQNLEQWVFRGVVVTLPRSPTQVGRFGTVVETGKFVPFHILA